MDIKKTKTHSAQSGGHSNRVEGPIRYLLSSFQFRAGDKNVFEGHNLPTLFIKSPVRYKHAAYLLEHFITLSVVLYHICTSSPFPIYKVITQTIIMAQNQAGDHAVFTPLSPTAFF